jgi:hypothetical protein
VRLAWDLALRSNYIILEQSDRESSLDAILRVATMHRADRVSAKEQKIATCFVNSQGRRTTPEFVHLQTIEQWLNA